MNDNNYFYIGVRLLVPLVILLLLNACGDGANEQQLVDNARSYIEQNRIRAAAIELKNALQRNPSNAEARFMLGNLNLEMGDPAAAQKEFRKAAAAGWNEEATKLGIARAMVNSGDYRKLLDSFEISETYAKSVRADLYGLKALAMAANADMAEAREALDTAEQLDPDALEVLKAGIQIELAAGKPEKAGMYIDRALKRYPQNRDVLLQSAVYAQQRNEPGEALEIYRTIIDRDPEITVTIYGRNARLGMARVYLAMRKLDDAEAVMKPLFKQNVSDPFVNYIGGLLAFEQGDLDLAKDRLLKVLKVAPEHSESNLLYGAVSFAQQDYEQAAYYIAKYVSDTPGNAGARKLLGRTYMILGRNEEARSTLQPALTANDGDGELLALIGLSQIKSGNLREGVEGLERAVQASPQNSAVRSELARAYISSGETERAIKELQFLLKNELTDADKVRTEALLILAHLKAGQHNLAIDTVLEMLETSPDDPDILTLAGNVFSAVGDREEARRYFTRARKIDPEHLQATMSLGVIEELEGHKGKAEELYRTLARSRGQFAAPMLSLARLAEERGDAEAMVDWLEKAHARFPDDMQAASILAEYYLRSGQADSSEHIVRDALKRNPGLVSLQLLQSRIDITRGQYNEALKRLGSILNRTSGSLYARSLYAEVFLNLGQLEDAREQLQQILDKDRNYPSALALMAKLELRDGNTARSREYVDRFMKVQPDSYIGHELDGDYHVTSGDFSAAVDAYSKAWQQTRNTGLAVKLARTMLQMNDYAGATAVLTEQLQSQPNDVQLVMMLANAHQLHGKPAQAAALYKKTLSIQPDNIVALNNLAWIYAAGEDISKALKLAERAYRLQPDDAGIQDTYGWLLVRDDQAEKGRHILEKAMDELSQLAEVRYHYAVALAKTGEKQKAIKMLSTLLQENAEFEGRTGAESYLRQLTGG